MSESTAEYITVIGAHYVPQVIPELLPKAFGAYKKRNPKKPVFQVSSVENTFSASSLVLVALSVESFRNRAYYCDPIPNPNRNVAISLGELFESKNGAFPKTHFEQLFQEIFIVRDTIVHNHIYKILSTTGSITEYTQDLLEDYGDGKRKSPDNVDEKTGLTQSLGLNVQPAKIGFEDLFIVLLVFDLFIGISNVLLKPNTVPFKFFHKNREGLYLYLSDLYRQLPHGEFIERVDNLSAELATKYKRFLPRNHNTKTFIQDTCPKCQKLGFSHGSEKLCKACNFGI